MHTQHRIEHALRRKLSGPSRQDVQQTMGWDKGAMSRFLSGEQGVLIDKLDTRLSDCNSPTDYHREQGAAALESG